MAERIGAEGPSWSLVIGLWVTWRFSQTSEVSVKTALDSHSRGTRNHPPGVGPALSNQAYLL